MVVLGRSSSSCSRSSSKVEGPCQRGAVDMRHGNAHTHTYTYIHIDMHIEDINSEDMIMMYSFCA